MTASQVFEIILWIIVAMMMAVLWHMDRELSRARVRAERAEHVARALERLRVDAETRRAAAESHARDLERLLQKRAVLPLPLEDFDIDELEPDDDEPAPFENALRLLAERDRREASYDVAAGLARFEAKLAENEPEGD